ncbi:unnamed protein product, partial [Symbiodinium sp. CCMP2456]
MPCYSNLPTRCVQDISLPDADDDEDDEEVHPFADLFGRLKSSVAKAKPAPAKPAGTKPSPSAAKAKGLNRNKRGTDPDGEGVAPTASNKATRVAADPKPGQDVSLSHDDEESLAKFTEQANAFLDLRAVDADDDAAFTAWSKDKLQSMMLLKTQINNKKKSLNRRSNKASNLGPSLDELLVNLNTIIDFVRKLSAGTVEGRRLYDAMGEIEDLLVCSTIWKRVLRAVAFDALKLAQWDTFFTETHELCVNHIVDHAMFFQLLASQLLQRLLKAIPMCKPITGETTSYIRAFVLVAINHSAKTQSTGWTADDHLDFLKSIKDVADFSTPPTVVKNAIARLKMDDGGEKHWAASSFQLPQGKKLFEAAIANATHKESQAGVLDVLHHAEEHLERSGLCTFETPFMVTVKSWFNASHGDMISESLRSLTDKKMKVLKGADKEKLDRVLLMARNGAVAIILAFVNFEMLPYMNTWASELRERKPSTDSMMSSSSCVMHLADASGHGQESLVEMIKDIAAFMTSTSEKIGSSDTTAENLSTLPTTWAVKTKAMIASLAACAAKAAVGEQADDLVDRAKSASAKLYSTILGDDVGKSVLTGVDAISTLVTAMVAETSLDQLAAAGDADEHAVDIQTHELIRSARKLEELTVEKLTTSVSELNGANDNTLSPDTLSNLGSICQRLIKRGQHEFDSIAKRCKDMLSKSVISDSDVEIPEFVQLLESYDQLDCAKIKDAFDLTAASNITSQITALGSAIDRVKELATLLVMDASEIVELKNFEAAYRNGIKWMGTCNILYLLISKAVSRAVLAGSKPSPKAVNQFTEAAK